jgi:hypothetical protein
VTAVVDQAAACIAHWKAGTAASGGGSSNPPGATPHPAACSQLPCIMALPPTLIVSCGRKYTSPAYPAPWHHALYQLHMQYQHAACTATAETCACPVEPLLTLIPASMSRCPCISCTPLVFRCWQATAMHCGYVGCTPAVVRRPQDKWPSYPQPIGSPEADSLTPYPLPFSLPTGVQPTAHQSTA